MKRHGSTSDDAAGSHGGSARRRFRWWPRWLKLRVVLALLILLGYAGWRYGWPPHLWETAVCPLQQIDSLDAARLVPECIDAGSLHSPSRTVLLATGSLDPAGKPVFELKSPYVDKKTVAARDATLPTLKLPSLAGRRFAAGVFWVDMPPEHQDHSGDGREPELAYAALITCDESRRWEEAAELVVDLNRNRDLTDDPVMKLSEAWSHQDGNKARDYQWFVRVFEPVTLARTVDGHQGDTELPATVEARPVIHALYHEGVLEYDRPSLAFCPTSYRRGQVKTNGTVRDMIIAPDGTRFGRYNGPRPPGWAVDSQAQWWSSTVWEYDRGKFHGCTLDAEGSQIRSGPYDGPTGELRVETASGERLRIGRFDFWLRGDDPHQVSSSGWAPVPRFSSLRLPVGRQPLPVGDYGIDRLWLTRGMSISIAIQRFAFATPDRVFSIHAGQTTTYRLPKRLALVAYAAIEDRSRPYTIDWVWSTTPHNKPREPSQWKGPRPGSTVKIGLETSDPATDANVAIYYRGDPPPDSLALVIKDASGKVVYRDTMEYG